MADYGMRALAYEAECRIGPAAAGTRLRRPLLNCGKPRFVAGSIGPTDRTASISPDVNDPAAHNVTFTELVDAYAGPPAA